MTSTFQKYRFDYLFILLIVIAGLLAVFFKIGEMPPSEYPWSDESDVASDAVATVRDGLQFHYPDQLAGGPLAIWLEAGWVALFGKGLTGLRVLNGLVNLVSVLLLYLLVRQLPLSPRPDWQFAGLTFNHWLAVTAALLFSVSTWILGLARIATPNWSLVPPMTTLTFYFLWLALNTNRRRYFLATGVMMGLLFYGYIPGYVVPLVPAIFLAFIWTGKHKRLSFPPSTLYLLPFPVTLIVATPIFIFFALHPVAVLQRVLQLIDTNEVSLINLMTQNLLDTLSAFGLWPNWLLQGRFEYVAFDPLATVLFVIGLLVVLRRRREPVYLFLLIWWVAMVAPAFLSRSASSGFIFEVWRRGIGAQPVSFVFVAYGAFAVVTAARWLQKWKRRDDQSLENPALQSGEADFSIGRALILPSLIAMIIVASGVLSYRLYFERWAKSGIIPIFFPAGPVRLVEWMEAESRADTLFIFPLRPNVSPTVRPELFTVRYLYESNATLAFPKMVEATVDQELAGLLERQPAVVKLMLHDRIVVDPKDYFEHALGWRGNIVSREKQPDFNVITYRLHPDRVLDPPVEGGGGESFEATNVAFGEALRLVGQRLQPAQLSAGQALGVTLRWAKASGGPEEADYNVSLALYNAQDDKIVTVDKPILNTGDYLTTRHWLPGEESTLYYTLPVPPETPPGQYTLRVVVYNAETGAQLPPAGGRIDLSLTLAEMKLWPNPASVDPATLTIARPIEARIPGGLRLIGAESSAASTNQPGDRLWLTLWWQATEVLSQDVGLMFALAVPDGEPVLLFEAPQPLLRDYPTTAWPTGHIYRVNYRVVLPATLTTGDYVLALRLLDLETTESLAEQTLNPISVEARTHIFDAPGLANQLNVDFEDTIRLRGFELTGLSPELLPGQEVRLKLQWQALREMPESYKIFFHLTGATGQIISQVDTLPQQGAVPTTGWVSGEIIEDELVLTIPPEMPSGSYRLVVGLYNEETGERLMAGQSDHVVLIEGNTTR